MSATDDDPFVGSLPVVGTGWGGHDPAEELTPGHAFETAGGERYRIDRKLGAGGMGTVYVATDARLRRTVALKFAAPGTAAEARLAQEAWIAAQLEHPGIVPVYDAGVLEDGRRYLVLRHLRGRTLHAMMQDAPAPRLNLLPILQSAADALATAHERGIVHRDLTPGNVFVGTDGEVHIIDWGLARPVDSPAGASWADDVLPAADAARTRAGVVLGTPGYMSPEQAVGAPVDPRADVWALGALGYEMLTGHPPFGGLPQQERQRAIAVQSVPDPRTEHSGLPDAVCELLVDALQRGPAQRPADAGAFVQRLRDALTPVPASPRRRPSFLTLLLVGGVGVVLGIGTASWRAPLEQSPTDPPEVLYAKAVDYARRGFPAEAELFAARSLTGEDSPVARGLLAHLRAGPSAELSVGAASPYACDVSSISPDGTEYLCIRDQRATYHALDGTELWQRTLSTTVRDVSQGDDHLAFFHPDSRAVAVARRTGEVVGAMLSNTWMLPNQDTGEVLWVPTGDGLYPVGSFNADGEMDTLAPPDGRLRAVLTDLDDGTLVAADGRRVWYRLPSGDWSTPTEWVQTNPSDGFRHAVSLGDRVLLVARSGTLLLWSPGQPLEQATRLETGLSIRSVQVAPSAQRALVVSESDVASVVELGSGAVMLTLPALPGVTPRLVDDVTVRAVSDHVLTWTLPERSGWPRRFKTRGGGVVHLDQSGDHVAWAGADGVEIWDRSLALLWSTTQSGGVYKTVQLSPSSTRAVVGGSLVGQPQIIELATGVAQDLERTSASTRRSAWLDDEHFATATYARGNPWIYKPQSPIPLTQYTLPRPALIDLVQGAEPGTAWALTDSRRLIHSSIHTGQSTTLATVLDDTYGLVRQPVVDPPWLIADKRLVQVDAHTGETLAQFTTGQTPIGCATQIDGEHVATGHVDGSVRVWHIDGTLLLNADLHDGRVGSLSVHDGMLLSGSWDGQILSWNLDVLTTEPAELIHDATQRWQRG